MCGDLFVKLKMKAGDFVETVSRALLFKVVGATSHQALKSVPVDVTAKGMLRVTVSSGQASARVTCGGLESFDAGRAVFDIEYLERAVSVFAGRKSMLTVDVFADRARLRCDGSQLTIPVLTSDDAITMPKPPADGAWHDVDVSAFVSACRHCLWATRNNDNAPLMQVVHLRDDVSEATTGHIYGCRRPGIVPAGVDSCVFYTVMSDVASLLRQAPQKEPLKLVVDGEARLWIRGRGWALVAKTVAFNYPNTRPLVFAVNDQWQHAAAARPMTVHCVYVNRSELIDIAEHVSRTRVSKDDADKIGPGVRFAVDGDGVLTAYSHYPSEDAGGLRYQSRVTVSPASPSSESIDAFSPLAKVAYSAHYLRTALASLTSPTVKMMWADDASAASLQFHDDEDGGYALISPRRL